MYALVFALALAVCAGRPAAAQVFAQHNLVSDDTSVVPADLPDSNLVNAWGLAAGPSTPWWVANNGTGTSTLYDGNTGAKVALTVMVPGDPTGVVFHNGSDFVVSDGTGDSGPSVFMFASEDGTISGWNPVVPPPQFSMQAFHVVDNSASGAVYKGLAVADTMDGDFLYATNFNAGTVDVFDGSFTPVHMPGAFTDALLPSGYAPFGIANLGGTIFVTYALQDADKHDDVAGPGHGFIDAFDTSGQLLHRIASRGPLNSPWGLVIAADSFGRFAGDLLVGNFGDGHIHAFQTRPLEPGKPDDHGPGKPDDHGPGESHDHGPGESHGHGPGESHGHGPGESHGHGPGESHGHGPGESHGHGPGVFHPHGALRGTDGKPITIDGLWSLAFGNDAQAGPSSTLFFTAGPFTESHGLFGSLTATHEHHGDMD
jgi:uncharacterized protein (TIGR03118 family)